VTAEVARREAPVTTRHTGSFGRVRAEDATALAMIIAELVGNAVEHGLPGGDQVWLDAQRSVKGDGEVLAVTVSDDGAGLPPDFDSARGGLGTQIVTSLVQDLQGEISWASRRGGEAAAGTAKPRGTVVRFLARLRPVRSGGSGDATGGVA